MRSDAEPADHPLIGDLLGTVDRQDVSHLGAPSGTHHSPDRRALKPSGKPAWKMDPNEAAFLERLYEAGIIDEIKAPITDFSPYQDRKPVEIMGTPLSETLIEERR